MVFEDADAIEQALALLGASLDAREASAYEIVVVGGAAMSVLGVGVRPTRDVDVLGLRAPGSLIKASPLPEELVIAATTVAEALGLASDWLNPGPTDLLDFGLPAGFQERLTARHFGPRLSVWFPSREDLICLKTYAAADLGPGRHTEDLHALHPTCDELLAAARWAQTHDPSEAFRVMLAGVLRYFRCEDAARHLESG